MAETAEGARKRLADLSDAELAEAGEHLLELDGFVTRQVSGNPGPGWDPVLDLLEKAHAELAAERQGRLKP